MDEGPRGGERRRAAQVSGGEARPGRVPPPARGLRGGGRAGAAAAAGSRSVPAGSGAGTGPRSPWALSSRGAPLAPISAEPLWPLLGPGSPLPGRPGPQAARLPLPLAPRRGGGQAVPGGTPGDAANCCPGKRRPRAAASCRSTAAVSAGRARPASATGCA